MSGRGAFTLSVFDVVLTSVDGVVFIRLCVLLQMQVTGPSWKYITIMLMETLGVLQCPCIYQLTDAVSCLVVST